MCFWRPACLFSLRWFHFVLKQTPQCALMNHMNELSATKMATRHLSPCHRSILLVHVVSTALIRIWMTTCQLLLLHRYRFSFVLKGMLGNQALDSFIWYLLRFRFFSCNSIAGYQIATDCCTCHVMYKILQRSLHYDSDESKTWSWWFPLNLICNGKMVRKIDLRAQAF